MTSKTLRVVSYNIHKGFSASNLTFVLSQIKESIRLIDADLVFLQEVVGHHEKRPTQSQFEFLADEVWPHFAYGKNALYKAGHHGNAILSKYPITAFENIDISTNRLERRGVLHASITVPFFERDLHAFCLHLDLLERGRKKQIQRLCHRIGEHVPKDSPLVIGGDFNDWGEAASTILEDSLKVGEAFLKKQGQHARTFPAILPVLRLDRIYFRNLNCIDARIFSKGIWRRLSDHAAVYAEFTTNLQLD